jgi:predicted nucleotidyltransferase
MYIPNMGRIEMTSPGLAGALFSAVQQRVLGLLIGQPGRDFSTSDVIRHVSSGTGAVHRELSRLAAAGILTVAKVGNQKRYRANTASPIFAELRGIVVKTVGVVDPIRTAISPLAGSMAAAFVFGSVAKGEDTSASDIDLMVVSDVLSHADLYAALERAEKTLGRPVNPTVMTAAEWWGKRAAGSSFVTRIRSQPKLFVVGSEDDLDRVAEPRADRPAQGRSAGPRGIRGTHRVRPHPAEGRAQTRPRARKPI